MGGTAHTISRPSRRRSSNPESLRLDLLGGFSLVAGSGPVDLPQLSKRLLAFLALKDRPQHRSFVAGSLWPDRPEARAAANLRGALWRLPAPASEPLVQLSGKELSLSPSVEVDVRTAEQVGWGLVQRGELPDVVDTHLFSSELLPGWYEDWIIVEQERLAALQMHFLEALAKELLHRKRIVEALDMALRLVAIDPIREASQRALALVYLADGNWRQALGQLDRYRKLLDETFGCEPSAELHDLVMMAVPSSQHQ